MSLSHREKELECCLHWFDGWSPMQKSDFLRDLVDKAVPQKVSTLFDAMNTLNMQDKPPSIFQCQLKLFDQWFTEWSDNERNELMRQLETRDPSFAERFHQEVAATSGQP